MRPNVSPRSARAAPAPATATPNAATTAGSPASPYSREWRRPIWSSAPPAASIPTMPG